MKKYELAKQLRQRQYDTGFVERHLVDALSIDQIIDSYITCNCCGEKQVNEKQLESVIHIAKNAGQFFQICDGMGKVHKHNEG
jgi:hypothetical protein